VRTCSEKPDPAAFEPGHAHTSTTLSVRYFCNTPILNALGAELWFVATKPIDIQVRFRIRPAYLPIIGTERPSGHYARQAHDHFLDLNIHLSEHLSVHSSLRFLCKGDFSVDIPFEAYALSGTRSTLGKGEVGDGVSIPAISGLDQSIVGYLEFHCQTADRERDGEAARMGDHSVVQVPEVKLCCLELTLVPATTAFKQYTVAGVAHFCDRFVGVLACIRIADGGLRP